MNKEFLKRLKTNFYTEYSLIENAKYLADLDYYKLNKFLDMSLDESVCIVKNILKEVDINYYVIFNKMINQQDCSKPVIYTLTSNNGVLYNESNTFNYEIFFYKTGTIADIYFLLHEFSHYLVNRNNSFKNDYNKKRYDEVLPILMEYIICDYLNNYEYIKFRINKTISCAKSILAKEEMKNGNYDLDLLFDKYKFNREDIILLKNDLLFSKSLKFEVEKRYIYGFIYANYFSSDIDKYKYLVEEYTNNRNILFPEVKIEKLFKKI